MNKNSSLKQLYLENRQRLLRLLRERPSVPVPDNPRSILIVSQQRLGDVCLELPWLRALRLARADSRVAIVAPSALHPLISWACSPDLLLDSPRSISRSIRLGRRLSAERWSVALDLTTDYFLGPALIARCCGADVSAGFENAGRGRFFHVPLRFDENIQVRGAFGAALRLLGVDSEASCAGLALGSAVQPRPRGRLAAIHPGATHWTQQWPAGHFARLAMRIREAGDTCVVLGSEQERGLVDRVVHGARGAAEPVFVRGVMELASAIRQAAVLICNNSGPLHLAGLLDVPTLSFMGPTVKHRWWPVGRARVLRRDDLPCIGCNLGYCPIGAHACLNEISPETAYDAYLELCLGLEVRR